MDRELIIKNLCRAISIVEAAPEESVKLDSYKSETKCGTFFCTFGLLSQDEYFQKQGITLTECKTPDDATVLHYDGSPMFAPPINTKEEFKALDNLFGEDAFDTLFSLRGVGSLDSQVGALKAAGTSMSDKDYALARLRMQLFLMKMEHFNARAS